MGGAGFDVFIVCFVSCYQTRTRLHLYFFERITFLFCFLIFLFLLHPFYITMQITKQVETAYRPNRPNRCRYCA